MPSLDFASSSGLRLDLSAQQTKRIRSMYEQARKQVSDRIQGLSALSSPTSTQSLQRLRLEQLKKSIEADMVNVSRKFSTLVKENMQSVANQSAVDAGDFAKAYGLKVTERFAAVTGAAVERILEGQVYSGDWKFSEAVWGTFNKNNEDIASIVAQGVTLNKSSLEIAKDLEMYVSPSAKKPWDWGKVYPGTNQKVDYNAQRLARTLVSHAYQLSTVQAALPNPFVESFQWRASGSERMCQICEQLDGQIFEKTEVPLDHPMGMCTIIQIMPSNMDISNRLADWVNGKEDVELDAYSVTLITGKYAEIVPPKPLSYNENVFKEEMNKAGLTVAQVQANPQLLVDAFSQESWLHGDLLDYFDSSGYVINTTKDMSLAIQDLMLTYQNNQKSVKWVTYQTSDSSKFVKQNYLNVFQSNILSGTPFNEKNIPMSFTKLLQTSNYTKSVEIWDSIKAEYGESNKDTSEAWFNKHFGKLKPMKEPNQPKLVTVQTPASTVSFPSSAYSSEAKDRAYWFKDRYDADKTLRPQVGKVWKTADMVERQAAYNYTAGSGKFNRPLRGFDQTWGNYQGIGKVSLNAEGAEKEINALTSIIEKSKIDNGIWLNRGVKRNGAAGFFQIDEDLLSGSESEIRDALIGKVVKDEAFTSTGSAKGLGFNEDITLNIYAPEGTKLIYAEPFSQYSRDSSHAKWDGEYDPGSYGSELETIIQRGTSYRVTKVEKQGYQVFVDLDIIDQDKFK